MNTELQIAKANYDMTLEAENIIRAAHQKTFEELLSALISDIHIPSFRVKDVRINVVPVINEDASYELEFNAECGFYNQDTDRLDFFSDLWIKFTKSEGVAINQSSSGFFGKDQFYQCQRAFVIAFILQNSSYIEAKMSELADKCMDLISAAQSTQISKQQLQTLETEYKLSEIKRIKNTFQVGMIICHKDTTPNSHCIINKGEHVIEKINSKNVLLKNSRKDGIKVSMDAIALSIFNDEMIMIPSERG